MNQSIGFRRFIPFFLGCLLIPGMMAGCAGGPQQASTGEYVDDTVLATRVKSALLRDPEVSGLDLQVETFKGRVQLSGFVDNEAQAQRAEAIARRVEGVREVVNETTVK